MSSRFKLILASGLWLLVSACGFHPMYGDASVQATQTPLQGNLAIDPIAGTTARVTQQMKAALEDRFNPEGIKFATPDYHLQVKLTQSLIPAVVRSDGTILRYIVRFDVTYSVTQNGVVLPVFKGTMRRSASYNVVPNADFATHVAEQDTTARLIQEMAEDFVLRIGSHFAAQPGPKVDTPKPATTPTSAASPFFVPMRY